MSLSSLKALALVCTLRIGCGDGGTAPPPDTGPAPLDATVSTDAAVDAAPLGPAVARMDFTRAGGLYAAPFPSEDLRLPDGRVDLRAFPNPRHIDFIQTLVDTLADAQGFSLTSGVFFALTAPLDPATLPALRQTTDPAAQIFLMNVDPGSPDYLRRHPVTVNFQLDGGPFGAPNLLALLPYQGLPLRPHSTYAAVLRRGLRDAAGNALPPAPALADLLAGRAPTGMSATAFGVYRDALTALRAATVDPQDVVALTVFRTGAPSDAMAAARDDALARPLPAPASPFALHEVFADYCVYESTVRMPVYQRGDAPFTAVGGDWAYDPQGHLQFQHDEEARLVVTLPRRAMPAAGFPATVFIRTGGGGDRPLVDRGVHATAHGEATTPGAGPALYFARAGFAGVSVDGPHGGLRNITHGDEQGLMFNFTNPPAMRDNVRQSALELILLAHVLEHLTVDASACPGLTVPAGRAASIDTGTLALMGHSMGGTIAPLVLAHEPRYRAGVLSGAGGSYIANVMYKQSPFAVLPLAELIVRYNGTGRHLHEHDPVLSLLQWAVESSDPPVYAADILRAPRGGAPRNILMLQGIVDTYIMPPIAAATSLSLGLDEAIPGLDGSDPRVARFAPLSSLLDLSGARALQLPAQGNFVGPGGATATAVVVQHAGDSIEDGHEVVFQTEAPKHQYQCFLESFARGVPRVPPAGGVMDPCP